MNRKSIWIAAFCVLAAARPLRAEGLDKAQIDKLKDLAGRSMHVGHRLLFVGEHQAGALLAPPKDDSAQEVIIGIVLYRKGETGSARITFEDGEVRVTPDFPADEELRFWLSFSP